MNEPLDQDALQYGSMMPERPKAVHCSALVSLPGQPLCKHYSGATLANLTGDYTCKCLAGVPYELFPSDMERWPCRRRHILGREQAECSVKDYGSEISGDVDTQVDEMAKRALRQANQALDRMTTAPTTPRLADDAQRGSHSVQRLVSSPERPILRYHGGKWLLAPWIIENMPAHKVYVEPFGGAASVLLRKQRSYAEIYNDLDGELVNLFRVARDNGEALRTSLELTPFSRVDFKESYEPTSDPLEQARRTVVRSFMGFGSNSHNKATGFRSNSNRSGTTPAHDWRNWPGCFGAIMERLRGVCIENRDACEVMLAHDSPQTLHYVDPPYVMTTRDKGSDYRHELTDEQHRHLAAVLNELQGMVMLSGYPCELYNELYADWKQIKRRALADGARERTEVLWLRNINQGGLLCGLDC